jgi:hypothetical protein
LRGAGGFGVASAPILLASRSVSSASITLPLASASGDSRRSEHAPAITRAASWGMTPASASAPASARSKSSIARTNASAESAWTNVSRAKLRPTMFTTLPWRAR